MSVEVRMLGLPHVLAPQGRTELGLDRVTALLVYLALRRDWVGRAELIYLFWPDVEEHRARANLRQILVRIRKRAFTRDLESATGRLRWLVDTDVERLLRALRREAWSEALELYAGDLLAELTLPGAPEFNDWLELERGDLRDRWRRALLERVGELERAGRPDAALEIADAALAAEPLDERALRAYLRIAGGSGRPSVALARYEGFRRTLRAELDLAPPPDLERLAAALRGGSPPDPAAPLRPDAAPAGRPLPLPPTPFVRRERDEAAVARMLRDPGCRLLTLLGPGGVGKTRLALACAAELADGYRDGAHWASLASVDEAFLATALADALSVDLRGAESPEVQLLAYLRDRHLLLVIDDFDDLLARTGLLVDIYRAAPGVTLLVTSRERLRVRGEWVVDVAGLPCPPTAEPAAPTPEPAPESAAVELLLQVAQRVRPDVDPDALDRATLIRICRAVGGVPLALELAGSWLRALSPEEIARELEAGGDLLERTFLDLPARQRSLRAVFEESWRRLQPAQRRALRRLSVFRGRVTAAAAAQVGAASLATLAALVDASLLRPAASGGFAWHPLVHRYARDKLAEEAGELAEQQERHARYVLAFAEGSRSALDGREPGPALDALDAALDDLRAAQAWLADHDPPAALQLLAMLTPFYELRGRFQEALDAGTRIAAALDGARAPLLAGRLAVRRAFFLGRLDRFDEAERLARRALALLGDAAPEERRAAHATLAFVAATKGAYERAERHHRDALAIAEAQRDPRQLSLDLVALARTELWLGEYPRAEARLERALALCRRSGDPFAREFALTVLGHLQLSTGRLADAEATLRAARDLAAGLGSSYEPESLLGLGVVQLELGDAPGAVRTLQEALELVERQRNHEFRARALIQRGRAATAAGDLERAWRCLIDGLAAAWDARTRPEVPAALLGIAELHAAWGERARAASLLAAIRDQRATTAFTRARAEALRAALGPAPGDDAAAGEREPAAEARLERVVARLLRAPRS